MSITVDTRTLGALCTSGGRSHKFEATPKPVLVVEVGDDRAELCLECARNLFNALGFMIMTKTGESIAQLVGLKPSKARVPR